MKRISKSEYYLGIARAVCKRSTCLKRRYGVIIVKNDVVISTGYNGSERGGANCCDEDNCPRMSLPHNSGDYSQCKGVHAEQNALLVPAIENLIGSDMYIYAEEYKIDEEESSRKEEEIYNWVEVNDAVEPCPSCLRQIKNAGINKIISRNGVIQL